MFKRFGAQIALGFGFIMLFLVVVAAVATVSLMENHRNGEQVLQMHQRYQSLSRIKESLAMESSSLRAYLLYKDDSYLTQYRPYHEQRERETEAFQSTAADPAERQLIGRFKEVSSQYDSIIDKDVLPPARAGQYEKAAEAASGRAIPVFKSAYNLISEYEKKGYEEFKSIAESSRRYSDMAVPVVVVLSALSMAGGILFAIMITIRVTAPVRQLLDCAGAVAGGNLDVQADIRGSSEIANLGETFNNMVKSLRQQRDELAAQNEELQAQEQELTSTLDQVSQDRSKLEALNDFNEALHLSIRLTDLCENMVGACLRKVQAGACALVVVDPESGGVKNVASAGLPGVFGRNGEVSELAGLAGRCLKEKSVLDVSYPATALTSTVLLGASCHTAHELYVPVVFRGTALGILVAARFDGDPFDYKDISLLEDMMKQGAIALNNALGHLQVEGMYARLTEQAAAVEELNSQLETEKNNLKSAQEITRAVIESLDEAVVMLDLDGRVGAVNRRWKDFFGEKSSALYGLDARELYQKTVSNLDNADKVLSDLAAATAGEMTRGETEAVREDRVFKIWTAPVLGKEGQVLGRLLVYRDITREAEIDRMKSEFVSTVSHELRTPLSSILGFSELLLIKELNEETRRKYVSTIHKEARRLTNLVNDFLDLQRMESGHQVYHMEEVRARGLISEVVMSFGKGHKHKIAIDAPEEMSVCADRERITQVLMNLLSNAVKFSPGSSEILVGLEQDGDLARFYVRDWGLGIPEDVQANLFTKFYRVDNSDRRKIGGTGLGLAICKEIIGAHGGSIWVQSGHGRGSTFYFTLRLQGETDWRSGKGHRPEAGSPGVPAAGRPGGPAAAAQSGKSVLLVEDDISLAGLLEGQLEEAGYRVMTSASGAEALVLVKETEPHAIVLDILLDGKLSGWDVLRQVKEDPVTASIPVVISSCLAEREMGMAMGASEYLVKPFPPQRLVEVVNRLAGKKGPRRSIMAAPGSPGYREWIVNKLREKGLTIMDIIQDRDVAFVVVGNTGQDSLKGESHD